LIKGIDLTLPYITSKMLPILIGSISFAQAATGIAGGCLRSIKRHPLSHRVTFL